MTAQANVRVPTSRPARPSRLRRNVGLVVLLVVVAWSALSIDIDLDRLAKLPVGVWLIFDRMFLRGGPDLSYLPTAIEFMVQSIQIAWVGTIIGAIVSLPIGFFAAKNVSSGVGEETPAPLEPMAIKNCRISSPVAAGKPLNEWVTRSVSEPSGR